MVVSTSAKQILCTMWPFLAKPKPWAFSESKKLLQRLYSDKIVTPLDGRSGQECEQHVRAIMTPLWTRLPRAINEYQKRVPEISSEDACNALRNPQESHSDLYYDLMSQLLELDGKTVDTGIHCAVEAFYASKEHQPGKIAFPSKEAES